MKIRILVLAVLAQLLLGDAHAAETSVRCAAVQCDKPVREYTLITVTHGGSVNHSRGYSSVRMCEQAKSLATTGRTIEQQEAWIEAENQRYRRELEAARAKQSRARSSTWIGGGLVSDMHIINPGDIKHAECVIEVSK